MLGKVVSRVLPMSLAQGECRNIGAGQGSFWLSEWDMASHGGGGEGARDVRDSPSWGQGTPNECQGHRVPCAWLGGVS